MEKKSREGIPMSEESLKEAYPYEYTLFVDG